MRRSSCLLPLPFWKLCGVGVGTPVAFGIALKLPRGRRQGSLKLLDERPAARGIGDDALENEQRVSHRSKPLLHRHLATILGVADHQARASVLSFSCGNVLADNANP